MDTTVNPCDDFWQFANGNWLKNNTIPAEYGMWSTWHETFEHTNTVLHEILERAAGTSTAAKGTPEQKIGDFYRVAMDTGIIEADGAKPLMAQMAFIAGLSTSPEIQKAVVKYHRMGIPVLFDVSAEADMKNPDIVMAYISQGGLGKLTLGENIADLGGLTITYNALQKALQGKPRQEIDGFTPEQRFFISYTAIWRTITRPEALKLWMNTMLPSPAEYRVRGPLANMPEFGNAFGCREDVKMLRKPEDRIKIW